jgi:hypothetical protein
VLPTLVLYMQTQTLPRCVKRSLPHLGNHLGKPPNPWRWRWGAACSMPRVSDIDDACGISAHHMFLSNCVVQVMRVWSLPAFLSPLAKQHIRHGVTQRTAYRISHGVCGGRGIRYHARIAGCLSAAQVARSLRTRPTRHECPWRRGV